MRRGLLGTRDELHSLRSRIARKPFDTIYDLLRKRCALILTTNPIKEAQWRSNWQQGIWGSAVTAARTAQGRIMDLLIAHHIDRNLAYRDRAIEELKNLISWTAWTDPCHGELAVDLCTAEAAVAAAVALDWLYEDITEADRLRVIHALRHRVIEPYRRCVQKKVWWYSCYHHWNAVVNSGCGLAALLLSDEETDAREVEHLSMEGLRHFFDALGREGGWDEGTGYWGYALRYLLLLGEARSRLVDDQRIFHARGMDSTGLFPIYFTPNGYAASFGDQPVVPLYGAFYLLVKHFGLKEVTWWLDTFAFHRDVSSTAWSAAGLALLCRPIDAETTREPALVPVKVFNEIGWAALADHWPRPNLHVAAKTGDLSANHAQRDMNSIQLQVDGEMLLVDLGQAPFSREYLSEERGEFYQVQARGHNTVTIGQRDHRIDAQGSIVEAQNGSDYRWVACDARTACGENVHFVRHLIMVVNPATHSGRMLVVLDELANPVPERVDVFWHTQGRIDLAPGQRTGAILGKRAGVYFGMVATTGIDVTTRTHPVTPQQADQFLQASIAQPPSRVLLATVFSREKLPAKMDIKETNKGSVTFRLGSTYMHFRRLKRHLQLDELSAR